MVGAAGAKRVPHLTFFRNDNGTGLKRGGHPPSLNLISKPRLKPVSIFNGNLIGALHWREMLPQTRFNPHNDDELLGFAKRINDLNSDGSTHETVRLSGLNSQDCDFDDDIVGVEKKLQELCSSLENLVEGGNLRGALGQNEYGACYGDGWNSSFGRQEGIHSPCSVQRKEDPTSLNMHSSSTSAKQGSADGLISADVVNANVVVSMTAGIESVAHDVNGSSPLMKKGSYASVINASDQVNSTNNEGFYGVVHSDRTRFEPEVSKKVNFRSLVNEEQVDNYDTVLPKAAMENVKNRDEVTKVPVWIKLHNVLVVAYSADGLSLIAAQVGKPIMLDAFTSSMCKDSWGRINIVRPLVEINFDSVLKHKVSKAIPMEDGTGYTREVIKVEYEWKPTHCTDCKIFGHTNDKCPKGVNNLDTPSDKLGQDIMMVFGLISQTQTFIGKKRVLKKRGADMDTTTQVGANDINKANGPSTSNSFDALNNMGVGADCGVSSSRDIQEEEPMAGLKTSQWNEDLKSDDEVDEFIFPVDNDDELLGFAKRINDLNSDGSTHETVRLSDLNSQDCDFDDDIVGIEKKLQELSSSLENLDKMNTGKRDGGNQGSRPLKSILKKTRYTSHVANEAAGSNSHAASGTNNAASVMGMGGTPPSVGKKVSIAPVVVDTVGGVNLSNNDVKCKTSGTSNDLGNGECNAAVFGNDDQVSMTAGIESVAHDVNGSSPLMKKGSYASVINASDQVDNYDTVLPKDAMENVKNRRGPWIILNTPLILNRRTPNVSVKRDEVSIAIPMEDGTRYTRGVIKVEYEWKPTHCTDWADCGVSSSRDIQEEERVAGLKTSQWNEDLNSDDEVDEFIFSEGDKGTQMAFIKGRQIIDGPLMINEIISWAKKERKRLFLFKVNFEKAFDSLNWNFLILVMSQMGFSLKWLNWTISCLNYSYASVLINGSPTKEFKLERGLRQCDPLSHFLFILVVEAINVVMSEAKNKTSSKGPRTTRDGFLINYRVSYIIEHSNRKDAPIRSPTRIEMGLEEHLAPMERSNKILIGDRDGFRAWYANQEQVVEMMRQHQEELNLARLEAQQARWTAESTQKSFNDFLAFFNSQRAQVGSSWYIPTPMYRPPPPMYRPTPQRIVPLAPECPPEIYRPTPQVFRPTPQVFPPGPGQMSRD
nr:cysteine-rich receptor-like protein kinase [Tanacetum cinerariifolium]